MTVNAALVLCSAAATSYSRAAGPWQCESQPAMGDALRVECVLDPAGSAQRYRFRANFSGGHDDTTASMTLTVDGAPLACDAGSKTSLQGEDGDVTLECRFPRPKTVGASPVLGVLLIW